MYVIGTAGHVDHGKSTLVTRLTGIDPDRLREEKQRGLTIDLGFAWVTLPSGRDVSVVDVPGHQRFVKNMLAGAGGLDLAVLVVAADEGVRPQTREHLAILEVLGVPSLIVALTKIDAVDDDLLELATLEVREFVDSYPRFAEAPIVPVSAVTGAGVEALLAAIDLALDATPERADLGRPRLSVDRVFTVQGFGTVVTGTLLDGGLDVGDEVELQPGGLVGRIRGLQRHGEQARHLSPGTRAAVNIAGVDAHEIERGMTLARPGTVAAVTSIAARLHAVPTLDAPTSRTAGVTVVAGSAETEARLHLLDQSELLPDDEAWAIVQFARPLPLAEGDRFVIRTSNETVAGGRVVLLEPPLRRGRRSRALIEDLARRMEASPEARILDQLDHGPLTAEALPAAAGVVGPAFDDALGALRAAGDVEEARGLLFARTWLERQLDAIVDAVRRALEERPLSSAIPQEEIRSRVRLEPTAFRVLLERAGEGGHVISRPDGTLTLPGYAVTLSPAQQRDAEAFLASLRAARFASVDALGDRALAGYVAAELAEDLGGGVVMDREAFEAMTATTVERIREQGSVTLPEVRDLLGTNRKNAQAYLERLDRLGVTLRTGDTRILRGQP